LETVRMSKAYTLSGGERRRLEIARSLTLQPSFILLDEPFSGVDPLTVKDLQEIIRDLAKSGIGVLITDHNVRETLSVTDHAYILKNGRIFGKGRPEELIANPVLEEQSEEPTQADNYSDENFLKEETEKVPEKPEPNPFDEFDVGTFFNHYLDTGGDGGQSQEREISERPSFEKFLSSPTGLTDHLQ